MSKKAPPKEEKGESAPLWIISFADMISLLMAFFVMLQTMAIPRSGTMGQAKPGVFENTMSSFQDSIRYFGLPELFKGEKGAPPHYAMKNPSKEKSVPPAADGREEKNRRIFNKLHDTAQTYLSTLNGKKPSYFPMPIIFPQTSNTLSTDSTAYLAGFVNTIRQTMVSEKNKICVIGVAPDVSGTEQQWLVSERRASVVAAYLKKAIPNLTDDNLHWWGAGKGGQWISTNKTSSDQSHIFIIILSEQ
jgi:outer membrane protein OmpA-like peptidoglycan-associated protein